MLKRTLNVVVMLVVLLVVTLYAASPASAQCVKIKDGILKDSANRFLVLGYDQFGYNYQAHMFNGTYDSVDRVLDGKYYGDTGDFTDDALIMKWSDEWLSNQDCPNLDGKLDRGGPGGTASKGWCTNQIEGDYLDSDGDSHHYTYFCKIVWVGPVTTPDPWASYRIWGEFAIVEEIYNDPFGGFHGVNRDKLVRPGFGLYGN